MSDYHLLNGLLSRVFVEIRAATALKKAQGLADIVHNVPGEIERGVPAAEILARLRLRAERIGAGDVIEGYIRSVAQPSMRKGRLGDLKAHDGGN